ncbi:DUF262 domain-containing protein [Thauera sp. 63]|uniref:DUF262 domain-containing protein n=1 Tax=Thauera sp. 63 TaxID=497321 RepID=UPI0002D0709F|nr:DUF262 domain-containing HNH endonuclease family protein [Thauera sp. 63]ENO78343.1 hypothetical protein C664_08338 [Thauera sp. 63]
MQISDVFSAHPKSVWEYLCENGQGLYVPAYQRQYSWDKSKISRLFEDACHGFTMLIDHEDSITFLGTIIAIHDTQYLTVNPLVKGDVPSRVMTIIDGQQRLTTLLLINTVLHEEIRYRSVKLQDQEHEDRQWLLEECMKVVGRLAKTFEEDKDYGDGAFRFYPRMIRAYDDSWSRKKGKANYTSPIGHYLHSYGQHGREEPKRPYKFEAPEGSSDQSKYKLLSDGRRTIQSLIKDVAKNNTQNLELPSFDVMIGARPFQDILVKADFPESVKATLTKDEAENFKELLRLVLFANFVLDRVAVTIVTAKNEDYAFDMFEALNTTGEPLTAFETFKPRVIHCEGLEAYETSKSHEYMKSVEGYLDGFGKTDDKQDATSRLIVAFASAERGEKLSKRLSEQRRFFKENFEKLGEGDPKKDFVRHLSHAAIFIQHAWPDDKAAKPRLFSVEEATADEVVLCLDLLRSFKHTITQGVLIRFYSEIRKADAENRPKAVESFIKAIKSCAAFSVLWRASRRTTDNIDMHYRKLMESGHAATGMPPLARRLSNGDESPAPDADLLQKALASILSIEGKIESKEDWVKSAAKIPAYRVQREVTRFILLAAAHDSADDKTAPGLTVAGKSGLLPLLDYSHWRDEGSQTVEHVAPQKRAEGWLDSLYDDDEIIDRLGNLTLLPGPENTSLSNASWTRKRLIYKVLSAATSDELDPLLQQAKDQGVDISKSTTELLENSRHLPMAKAVAAVEGDWTLDLVDRRSVRIAELAWARIAPWLGLPG